jgi:predicted DNA-binding transcriptional regulator YafY
MLQKRLEAVTGEKVDPRTIRSYLSTLRELDFEVSEYDEKSKGYYLKSRDFEEYEIKILMDCIASCQFVTHRQTKKIMGKLQRLISNYKGERLQRELYIDNRAKSKNSYTVYSIDKINQAIIRDRKISFNYYHYNFKGELVPRTNTEGNEAKVYTVSPVAMILKQECYYLVGLTDKHDNLLHFRIDRMKDVKVHKESRRDIREVEEFHKGFNAATYSKKSFKMFSGKDCNVVIKLKNHLLDLIIDELGNDVKLYEVEEGYFVARFTAKESWGLTKWIMQLGSDAVVLEPQSLVDQVKEQINKMKLNYV